MTQERKKPDIAKELHHAQRYLVEQELVRFLEELLGRVPSDEECEKKTIWARFSKTPLTVYKKDGVEFSHFFVWDRKEAVALGFHDSNDLLALNFARVPTDAWPTALRLYVDQYPP